MRMIAFLTFPVETFNAAVRDGSVGAKMKKILDHVKPEAAYFTDRNGQRSAVLILDLKDASKIPSLMEPWFLVFNAAVEIHPIMAAEELARAGLDSLGKEWAA
jgi:hypothetical protein